MASAPPCLKGVCVMKPFWSKLNKKTSSVQTKPKPKAQTTSKKKPESWKLSAPPKLPQRPTATYVMPPPPKAARPDGKEPAQKTEPRVISPTNREVRQNFLKTFRNLTAKKRDWDAWSDFVTMAACSISNTVDKSHYEEREETYLQIISKYSKLEQQLFPKLLAYTALALEENPEQDFLGEIYTELGLNSKEHKQIFTPYHVCHSMAEITFGDLVAQVEEKGFVEINDCCCGAGATLIAAANVAKEKLSKANLNYQNHILITGQDIDSLVTMMCYIQLSLLGIAGYFKVGNALTDPITDKECLDNYWFTPMYFSPVWHYRRIWYSIGKLFEPNEDEAVTGG